MNAEVDHQQSQVMTPKKLHIAMQILHCPLNICKQCFSEQAYSPKLEAYCQNKASSKTRLMTDLSKSFGGLYRAQDVCQSRADDMHQLSEQLEQV